MILVTFVSIVGNLIYTVSKLGVIVFGTPCTVDSLSLWLCDDRQDLVLPGDLS